MSDTEQKGLAARLSAKPPAHLDGAPTPNVTVVHSDGPKPEDATTAENAQASAIVPPVAPVMEESLSMSPAVTSEALAALAQTPNRRDDIQPKTMENVQTLDPSVSVLAKADARGGPAPGQQIFMSKFPKLVMYVRTPYMREVRVEFKDGVFATSNPDIADAMRRHPRYGMLFRGENNVRTAAVRQEAARQREGMRAPTFAGTGTSVDGSEQVFFSADRTLQELERRAIESGSVE